MCCDNLGGPPHFAPLSTRLMQWSPVAVHSSVANGQRVVGGWTEQWTCQSCSHNVPLAEVVPAGPQQPCQTCNRWNAWVHDAQTGAGEWRCISCDHRALARAVRTNGREVTTAPASGPTAQTTLGWDRQ
eukprot:5733904-Karenia_brevis.AAC.1